jgi:hypothetical protein
MDPGRVPGLENLAWVTLVLVDGFLDGNTKTRVRGLESGRLRHLLERADIPTDIDAAAFPRWRLRDS